MFKKCLNFIQQMLIKQINRCFAYFCKINLLIVIIVIIIIFSTKIIF